MELKKVSELNEDYIEVIVSDYQAKKRYFDDSEIYGWLILNGEEGLRFYHLYRRGYDLENKEHIDEPIIFIDEYFKDQHLVDETQRMTEETITQFQIGENKELFEKVTSIMR